MQTHLKQRDVVSEPKTKAPPLSCDSHCHILGPQSKFPFSPDRSFTPAEALSDQYLAMLATLGVERTVIVQPSVYGLDNGRTVEAVREIGHHRARGIAMVGANVTDAELDRLAQGGIRGMRFITTARGGPSLDQLPDVAARIAPLGWHIEMYVPKHEWTALLPVIDKLPVPVVFDHMGGIPADGVDDPILERILTLASEERAWIKLCGYRNSVAGYPYADVAPLAQRIVARVPDRCVWGTDWPHMSMTAHMPDGGELLDLLSDWAPDAAVRKKILVDNPARLYRFD